MSRSLFFKVLPRGGVSSSLSSTKTSAFRPHLAFTKPAATPPSKFANQFTPRFFSASTATMSEHGSVKVFFDLNWEGPVLENGRPTATVKSK